MALFNTFAINNDKLLFMIFSIPNFYSMHNIYTLHIYSRYYEVYEYNLSNLPIHKKN